MPGPIAKTFQMLSATSNPFAGEVMVGALDVPIPSIQNEAIQAIIRRGSVREQIEAIRRYPGFSAEIRRQLEDSAPSMVPAIRQCLLVGRGELEPAALELTRAGEAFGVMETILDILRSDQSELYEEAVNTLRYLVNRLYEAVSGQRGPDQPPLKNIDQTRHNAVTALDKSLAHFYELAHPEVVVEAIFVLAGPGHAAAQKLFSEGSVECRSLARETLFQSRHPGVMRFLLDSLSKPYPPSRVLEAIQQRDDPEFVLATLRWTPGRWTSTQERNLRQIEELAWLKADGEMLELIPEDLQTALIAFTSAAGLSRDAKLAVRQWVVRFGCPEARTAAIAVLEELDSTTVKEIVLDGLDSEDPSVQAWATGQLRSQQVPDALQRLIEQLDNPEACVQAVARQELQGFDLECLLSRFESLSPAARENAGGLLRKIDPDCLGKLFREYQHPIRRRRVRAIRGTLAYGFQIEASAALLAILREDDALLRRSAVEVLAHVPTPDVVTALQAMRNDPSDRVRDAVEQALAALAKKDLIDPPLEMTRSR